MRVVCFNACTLLCGLDEFSCCPSTTVSCILVADCDAIANRITASQCDIGPTFYTLCCRVVLKVVQASVTLATTKLRTVLWCTILLSPTMC